MSSQDAESSKMSWLAPREQKEFIRLMKELGLTRKERLDQETRRVQAGKPAILGDGHSLARVMSELGKADQVTLTQQVTVKKKDPSIIDVEGEVIGEKTDDS